jgi:uncharacterized protein (DUF1778 family)
MLSRDTKSLLTRAAAYAGVSLSNFLLSAASDHASAVIAEHESAALSARDWEAFVAALDFADHPSATLRPEQRRQRDWRDF